MNSVIALLIAMSACVAVILFVVWDWRKLEKDVGVPTKTQRPTATVSSTPFIDYGTYDSGNAGSTDCPMESGSTGYGGAADCGTSGGGGDAS